MRLPAACHCADAVLGMRTAKHAQQPTACLRCACPPDTDQAITCEDMRACAVADVACMSQLDVTCAALEVELTAANSNSIM